MFGAKRQHSSQLAEIRSNDRPGFAKPGAEQRHTGQVHAFPEGPTAHQQKFAVLRSWSLSYALHKLILYYKGACECS
jgi:hypothetical protein